MGKEILYFSGYDYTTRRGIFVIFDIKNSISLIFLSLLRNRFPSIKFTFEIGNILPLPFLNVLVIRNRGNELKYELFRKDTHIYQYIPNV